jgi:hypothetical protein
MSTVIPTQVNSASNSSSSAKFGRTIEATMLTRNRNGTVAQITMSRCARISKRPPKKPSIAPIGTPMRYSSSASSSAKERRSGTHTPCAQIHRARGHPCPGGARIHPDAPAAEQGRARPLDTDVLKRAVRIGRQDDEVALLLQLVLALELAVVAFGAIAHLPELLTAVEVRAEEPSDERQRDQPGLDRREVPLPVVVDHQRLVVDQQRQETRAHTRSPAPRANSTLGAGF